MDPIRDVRFGVADLSSFLGISLSRVSQLRSEGKLTFDEEGTIRLSEIPAERIHARLDLAAEIAAVPERPALVLDPAMRVLAANWRAENALFRSCEDMRAWPLRDVGIGGLPLHATGLPRQLSVRISQGTCRPSEQRRVGVRYRDSTGDMPGGDVVFDIPSLLEDKRDRIQEHLKEISRKLPGKWVATPTIASYPALGGRSFDATLRLRELRGQSMLLAEIVVDSLADRLEEDIARFQFSPGEYWRAEFEKLLQEYAADLANGFPAESATVFFFCPGSSIRTEGDDTDSKSPRHLAPLGAWGTPAEMISHEFYAEKRVGNSGLVYDVLESAKMLAVDFAPHSPQRERVRLPNFAVYDSCSRFEAGLRNAILIPIIVGDEFSRTVVGVLRLLNCFSPVSRRDFELVQDIEAVSQRYASELNSIAQRLGWMYFSVIFASAMELTASMISACQTEEDHSRFYQRVEQAVREALDLEFVVVWEEDPSARVMRPVAGNVPTRSWSPTALARERSGPGIALSYSAIGQALTLVPVRTSDDKDHLRLRLENGGFTPGPSVPPDRLYGPDAPIWNGFEVPFTTSDGAIRSTVGFYNSWMGQEGPFATVMLPVCKNLARLMALRRSLSRHGPSRADG